MAKQRDVLEALGDKEEAARTADLATEIKAGEASVRTWLNRLKDKGYVDGSGKEGWFITDEGREALEKGWGLVVSPEDVGADTASKLRHYGQIAGVSADKITGAIELILSKDPADLAWVWEAMTQMDIPIDKRRVLFNLWRNYIKQGIPPELKEEVLGAEEEEKDKGLAETVTRKGGRDYIIAEDTPVFVGEGLGEFSFQQVERVLALNALKARAAASPRTSASGQQGLTFEDVKSIIDLVQQGQPGAPKGYIVTQGEEGVVVEEIDQGKPVVLSGNTGGGKTLVYNEETGTLEEVKPGQPVVIKKGEAPKSWVVDPAAGTVKPLEPGEPVVIKQVSQLPGKTFVVRPDGTMDEAVPGQPIIIKEAAKNPEGFLPVDLTDGEGKPVGSIKLSLGEYIGYQKDAAVIRQAEEKHEQTLGILGAIRENIPFVARHIDRLIAGRGTGGTPGPGGGPPMVDVTCDQCGRATQVASGTPSFVCEECSYENVITWK